MGGSLEKQHRCCRATLTLSADRKCVCLYSCSSRLYFWFISIEFTHQQRSWLLWRSLSFFCLIVSRPHFTTCPTSSLLFKSTNQIGELIKRMRIRKWNASFWPWLPFLFFLDSTWRSGWLLLESRLKTKLNEAFGGKNQTNFTQLKLSIQHTSHLKVI